MKTLLNTKFLGLCFLALLVFGSSHLHAQTIEDNVEATIDKSTSDSDFKDIKSMLGEYGLDISFKNIKRNENNEITGITIELSDGNNQSSSSMSSNSPIGELSFGSKNGNIFIGNSDSYENGFAFFGNGKPFMKFNRDSIFSKMKAFNLEDFFGDDAQAFGFFGNSKDMDSLMKKFQKNFSWNGNGNGNSFMFYEDNESNAAPSQRFKFIDNPDKDTLIVIDGVISDFKTLDRLAKENKLSTVDVLKSETAVSIYGDKAKDGAIIATTEK